MQCGRNADATEHRSVSKANLQVRRRLKTDLPTVNERLRIQSLRPGTNCCVGSGVDKVVAAELSDKGLQSHGPEELQKTWQNEWRNPADTEHIDRLGVGTEHHGATIARTPVQTLLAKTDLPVAKRQASVSLKQVELLD